VRIPGHDAVDLETLVAADNTGFDTYLSQSR
jgi:2,5-furandicarboxylate decarboxylase 1